MPIDKWRPWIQIALGIVFVAFLGAFFDLLPGAREDGWPQVIGRRREWMVAHVTVFFYVLGLASLFLPPANPKLPGPSIGLEGPLSYPLLMLVIAGWWVYSTVTSATGQVTDSLLGAQLSLATAAISIIRGPSGKPSTLAYSPERYVFGFLVFCVGLLLMWCDSEYWGLVASGNVPATPELQEAARRAYPSWRWMNPTLIVAWLLGGAVAFTKPDWLDLISKFGIALLLIIFVVFVGIGGCTA